MTTQQLRAFIATYLLPVLRWLLAILRLGAFVFTCVLAIFIVLEVASLGMGTTEFGTSPGMKTIVRAWMAQMMWAGVTIAILHLTWDLCIWLVNKFELLICIMVIGLVLLLVSVGLGTTELGNTVSMRASVHTWASRIMWVGVGVAVLNLAGDLFMWLLANFGLTDLEKEYDDY